MITMYSAGARSAIQFLAVLAAAWFAVPVAQAQICAGDVTLSSQAEGNAFDCTEVTGGLIVSGGDISDLSPISGLTTVGQYFVIQENPAMLALAGLDGLISIGDLSIEGNTALVSIMGPESVTAVGGQLGIYANPVLASLAGLEPAVAGQLVLQVHRLGDATQRR